MTSAPLLACRQLTLAVPGRALCTDLDFEVRSGECWVVLGPNGAGKSSLLATLAGLNTAGAGTIAYGGVPLMQLPVRARARHRGWLPQDYVDYFPATVLETVLIGRHPHLSRWQWESAADLQRAQQALAEVGLPGFAQRSLASLSGGERRRVALAALLAQDPALLLLDEPASHLDLHHQIEILDLLTDLAHARGKALVMALHELHLALRYADHAIALGGGEARVGPATTILTVDAMSALFGHPLRAVGEGRARSFVPV